MFHGAILTDFVFASGRLPGKTKSENMETIEHEQIREYLKNKPIPSELKKQRQNFIRNAVCLELKKEKNYTTLVLLIVAAS